VATNAARAKLLHLALPGTTLTLTVFRLLATVYLVKTAMSAPQADKFNVLQDSTRQVKLTTARPVHPGTTAQTQALALPLPAPVVNTQTSKRRLAQRAQPTTLQPEVKQAALQFRQVSTSQRQEPNTQELPNAVKRLSVTGVIMDAPFAQMVTSVLKRVSFTGGNKVALVAPTA